MKGYLKVSRERNCAGLDKDGATLSQTKLRCQSVSRNPTLGCARRSKNESEQKRERRALEKKVRHPDLVARII